MPKLYDLRPTINENLNIGWRPISKGNYWHARMHSKNDKKRYYRSHKIHHEESNALERKAQQLALKAFQEFTNKVSTGVNPT